MSTLSMFGSAMAGMMNPTALLLLFAGVVVGIVFDSIPGLSAAVAEVLSFAEGVIKSGKTIMIKQDYKIKGVGFSVKEFIQQLPNAVRSAVIGTGIGILPGIGGSTAGILSYTD